MGFTEAKSEFDFDLDNGDPPTRIKACTARYTELQQRVKKIIDSSTWWERYGIDRCIILAAIFLVYPFGLLLLRADSWLVSLLAVFVLGWYHHVMVLKLPHLASHRALGLSDAWTKAAMWLCEAVMSFPYDVASLEHVSTHHPHTNIIGLGDSSIWKMPLLPAWLYMGVAPLLMPIFAGIFGVKELIERRWWSALARFLLTTTVGTLTHYWLLVNVSGVSLWWAPVFVWLTRAPFFIPYIHVNIFQHIGLAFFRQDNRPDRLTQMANGVLNLPRNWIIEWNFGHSLINCHVEHHLFTTLSDNMCLKIKPTVEKFFEENDLPYNERSYSNRFWLFIKHYDKLMVNAPPITQFLAVR